ncbi:hypothetical protein [Vulcanisaeta sp. JCM 14467]|uniref:hypothetical protein n=1 Tax=Vulcanisaeta sp. JCM 14467 TaxID=1295370 RepID=UPI0006D24D1A|nr:hypothetical protein [Vulcanisaeta sp. JCM 14467]
MSSALGEFGELNVDSLRRNRFCMGVKRGNEYQCGDEANKNTIDKAVELLGEAVRRILRWRVWDSWWVVKWMDERLMARDRLETQLREKYSDDVVNDLLGMVDKFISYNEDFWRYWQTVDSDVKELIRDIVDGKAEIITWSNEGGVSVYRERITLETHRTSTGGITVQLKPKGLEA